LNKYSVFSLITLVIFVFMFNGILFGTTFGASGKIYIIAMFLIPLIGVFLGVKAKKGILKWLLILFNIAAICIMAYLLLLAYGISES
jgi:hypothetical protein